MTNGHKIMVQLHLDLKIEELVCELILNYANEIKALKQGKTKILRVYFNKTSMNMLKFVPNVCVELRYSRGRFFL